MTLQDDSTIQSEEYFCVGPGTRYIQGHSIYGDETWYSGGTYVVQGSIYIASGGTLTIESGVRVELNEGVAVSVSGTLIATGVRFTAKDQAKPWGWIMFNEAGSKDSRLENCVLEYAHGHYNYDNTYNFGVIFLQNASPTIKGCTIDKSSSPKGIYIVNGSPVIQGNTINGFSLYGIYVDYMSFPNVTGNTITNNQYGIYVYGGGTYQGNTIKRNITYGLYYTGSATIDATSSDWGDPSGPLDDSDDRATGGLYNPNGKGNKVSDHVNYYPWQGLSQGQPAVPTGLKGTPGNGFIDLRWNAITGPDVGGYKVYFGTSSGNHGPPIVLGNVTTHRLTNRSNGTLYYIAVSSLNAVGVESAKSSEIVVIPNSGAVIETIVSMGDSITAGYDGLDTYADCYVPRLGNLLGKPIFNEGIGGEISADGAARIDEVLSRYNPRFLTIYYGNNDAGFYSTESSIESLTTIIDRCLANGTTPVLATLGLQFGEWAWRGPYITELNQAIRQLAVEKGIPLGDLETALHGDSQYYANDIHPNSAGHQIIATTFFNAITSDTVAPTPNPPIWQNVPAAQGPGAVGMTAAPVTDAASQPVQYFFHFTGNATGGTGGADSVWQSSPTYTNAGLQPNHRYAYQVKARDAAQTPNETQYSAIASSLTQANLPSGASFANPTLTSIQVRWQANGNPNGTEYLCKNVTTGTDSGWITGTSWDNTGLECDKTYAYLVRARNVDGTVTDWFDAGIRATQACPPPPESYHPADKEKDYRIAISECTSYGFAWKTGASWPTDPNPIPIGYMTNACFLWKVGEVYRYDGTVPQGTPPYVTGP